MGSILHQGIRESIKSDAERRGVKGLLHFTSVKNLHKILKKGLRSREVLDSKGIIYDCNDKKRLEGYLNSISLSIMFPNYKMFHKYAESKEEDMVVIAIRPEVLWEKDCAFYHHNAASSEFHAYEAEELKDFKSWQSMFYDETVRAERNLASFYPTNPQAEVLCFETIEPKYIMGFFVRNNAVVNRNEEIKKCSTDIYKVDDFFFWPREDYKYW